VREAIRTKHYSKRTEQAYVQWIKRFIHYHNKQHPAEMSEQEINQYLTHLAVKGQVAASTQNQALCALVFLYREVLKKEIADFSDSMVWAKKPKKLPEVFTPEEARTVLSHLDGVYWLMGLLMYGAGLRVLECLRLRVKDLDFTYKKITVREGMGVRSPADFHGDNGFLHSTNLLQELPPALEQQFREIVKNRYAGNLTTAVKAFLTLHGINGS